MTYQEKKGKDGLYHKEKKWRYELSYLIIFFYDERKMDIKLIQDGETNEKWPEEKKKRKTVRELKQ